MGCKYSNVENNQIHKLGEKKRWKIRALKLLTQEVRKRKIKPKKVEGRK